MKGTLTIIALILCILTGVVWGLTGWHINQDINGWKTRAQVSSEPNDMYKWMGYVQDGMEKWDMTSGSAALVFHTPANDMSLIYHTVQQHVDQAQILTTMDRSSPEYQTGLDNLRGSIRELDLHSGQYWANHQGLPFTLTFWISLIIFCVFGFWWLIENA